MTIYIAVALCVETSGILVKLPSFTVLVDIESTILLTSLCNIFDIHVIL